MKASDRLQLRCARAQLPALALWGLVAVSACQSGTEADKGAAAQAPAKLARKVQLVRARTVPLSDKVSVSGTLAAEDRVDVAAKTPGRLVSIGIDLGSVVKRGQTIAQIETVDHRARVAQAEAAVAQARALLGLAPHAKDDTLDVEQTPVVRNARATLKEATENLERSRILLERKLIGRADFDAVEATFARAESALASAREEIYNRQALLRQRSAELMLARLALADTSLVSPIDGVVQIRHVSVGAMLTTGVKVATIVRIDPLRLRLEIPEHAAGRIAVGQTVQVIPADGHTYEGRIARLAPAIDEQNRTLTVEAEVPNPGVLRPGSFVRAEIALNAADNVVAIPSRSIVVFAGIEKVVTVKDGKALEVVIQSGRRSGDLTEVKNGLAEGAEIVLEPGNLQTGDPVVADEAPDPSRAEAG